jgi:IS1 family transposase
LTNAEAFIIIQSMNRLPIARRSALLGMLVEGNSLRATSRLGNVSINTVTKLVVDLGFACAAYHDQTVRNLTCKRIQCDEIWAFCYAKQKNVPADKQGQFGYGDVWTWVALDADTKLVPSWCVGSRGASTAHGFMRDLAKRLANRVQLTTDGHRIYLDAVESAFGSDIDYSMLVKIYGNDAQPDTRYSPPECIGCQTVGITGKPNPRYISTSHVERQNLTMRMGMRRFTHLTNAFSKKIENHVAMVTIHFMYYNFGRIHKTLRVTPGMAAGLTDHVWSLEEIASLAN